EQHGLPAKERDLREDADRPEEADRGVGVAVALQVEREEHVERRVREEHQEIGDEERGHGALAQAGAPADAGRDPRRPRQRGAARRTPTTMIPPAMAARNQGNASAPARSRAGPTATTAITKPTDPHSRMAP